MPVIHRLRALLGGGTLLPQAWGVWAGPAALDVPDLSARAAVAFGSQMTLETSDCSTLADRYLGWAREQINLAAKASSEKYKKGHMLLAERYLLLAARELIATEGQAQQETGQNAAA
jgi:hypothetical protein